MSKHAHSCPTCHQAVSWEDNVYRPFCSDRCRLIDLQGWFGERYRVPHDEDSDPDDTENLTEHNRDSLPN